MGQAQAVFEEPRRDALSEIVPSPIHVKKRYTSSPNASPRCFECTADTKSAAVAALLHTIRVMIDDETSLFTYEQTTTTHDNGNDDNDDDGCVPVHQILFCIQRERYFPVKILTTVRNQYQATIRIF